MRSLDPIRPASRWRPSRTRPFSATLGVCSLLLLCLPAGVSRAQVREEPSLPPPRLPLFAPGKLVALAPPNPAARSIAAYPKQFVSGDTIEIVARRESLLGDRLALARYPYLAASDFRVRRPVPLSFVLRPKPFELSRFSCAIHGADLGAGAASTLGGLGLVSGLWGEKTTGYLMGAGAILGVLWGGTVGANDSRFRIRAGFDPDGLPAGRNRPRPDGRE